MAGISNVQSSISTGFQWQVSNNLTGAAYNPISNAGNIRKTCSVGTAAGNAVAGGGDEVFSFQQGIAGGGSATLDLTAMTNILQQTGVSIARIKAWQVRLLSATDDATISPAPTATSTVTVTNNGPAVPSPLDFGNGGSGLTLVLTVTSTSVTGVAIGAAGSGYPPSSIFTVAPVQAGGSGAVVTVTTNSSGVPTSVAVVSTGGTGYTAATVPTVVLGQYTINTGGVHACFDPLAAGIILVSATAKNVKFINNDAGHAITLEIDALAATT